MTDKHLHIIDHPLIVDSLGHLRDQTTELSSFRRHSDQLCLLLFGEAIKGLSYGDEEVITPMEIPLRIKRLQDEIIIVPVLRSGLVMLFGAMHLLPKAKIGFAGMERDEETARAREYYWKMPTVRTNSVVIITDPMLATGGSLLHLLERVVPLHPKEVRLVCVVAAQEGLKLIRQKFPEVEIFTAAVDEKLNSSKFILPGVGDYGDRYFGTSV